MAEGDVVIDEPRVRAYIQGFLNSNFYRGNQASEALVAANQGAFAEGIWSRGFPEFMDIFFQEWDKKYPK